MIKFYNRTMGGDMNHGHNDVRNILNIGNFYRGGRDTFASFRALSAIAKNADTSSQIESIVELLEIVSQINFFELNSTLEKDRRMAFSTGLSTMNAFVEVCNKILSWGEGYISVVPLMPRLRKVVSNMILTNYGDRMTEDDFYAHSPEYRSFKNYLDTCLIYEDADKINQIRSRREYE